MFVSVIYSIHPVDELEELEDNIWLKCILEVMSILEDVPFQTPVGPLGVEVQLPTAPDIPYGFNLERWIMTGQQPVCQAPSCPPYWMMFSCPQENQVIDHRGGDPWAPRPRPRSYSLNSADTRWLHHRTVKFLITDSDDEDGYCENNEGSLAEGARHCVNIRERPRSAAPKDPLSRVKDMHLGPSTHHCKPDSSHIFRGHRTTSSLPDCRQPLRAVEQHRSQLASPHSQGQKNTKKRQRSLCSVGRKYSQNTPPAGLSSSKLQQQRPSSAGPVVKNHRKKVLTTSGCHGVFFDSAAELLTALSQEERELLETITEKGYPLRTAILALQKTGYRSPEKVLKYLVASDHLCQLGYDEAQVEEALEMFQNCETKAAEFLRLLTQFNEMGFQQSTIKEVLLVHENHHERALEELMTRMA
ncbi:ubiquitin-associated protein 1-like [Melanotaenia boesemani]|uniref:ubiquitin-associated protein 1-like n=1 Tax=Melanotaenia boesemani TaxID=1250792 RepID=UPI001C047FBD|nr:ubiquitin-associated protein 1-like [Melanotaenia boesemani]